MQATHRGVLACVWRTIVFSSIAVLMTTLAYAQGGGHIALRFANYFPPTAKQSKLCEDFIQEVQKRTNGKVQISYYPGGSLLKAPAMYEGIMRGLADIGFSVCVYTPGRFPVTEACELPHGYPSGWVSSHVASDFHQKFKPKEWDDVKVLVMHACSPNVLIGKKAARTLEDLQGYTIRAPGRMGDTVKALGGTPRPTPMAETYEGMSKGVLHGVTTPLETLKTWRFAEVASHVTLSWEVGNVQHFYVVMNKKKYQDLPGDVRKVFDELSVDFAERFAKMWVDIDFEGRDYAKEKGVELIQLSDSETKRWKQAVKPVIDNFVKDMKDKGVSESEATGYIAYIQERIAYWTQKQIEMGIKSVTGPEGMRAK